MWVGKQDLVVGGRRRLLALLAAAVLALVVSLAVATTRASAAAAPEKTDIVFIFDTSGSMNTVLEEAKEEIKTLIANTEASLPNVEFGVANVEDIPGYGFGQLETTLQETEYESDPEKPWHLWQTLTSNETAVEEAIGNLSGSEVAHNGYDLPEAYGRALYETATNPQVGWRAGARHEIVMIADNVPHTPNVNEGIPSELQFTEADNDGFPTWPNTGEELGGKWGIPDTQWKAGESLEFHQTLQKLDAEEKPLAMVDYFHTNNTPTENYVHYWEYWAAATGGQAISANEGTKELDTRLAEIIKESAEGIPPCPPGYERTATTPCVKKPPPAPTPPPTKVSGPSTSPPTPKVVIIDEEDGEIEDEVDFPEAGDADYSGEVTDGAEAARFLGLQTDLFSTQPGQPVAITAKNHKSKKCKKGFVKKGKKCVSNAPIPYGSLQITIPSAGNYKLKLKPSGKALAALKQGKTLDVKVTLEFTPAGTTTHILNTQFVKVHLKPKKHHGKGKKGKGKKK